MYAIGYWRQTWLNCFNLYYEPLHCADFHTSISSSMSLYLYLSHLLTPYAPVCTLRSQHKQLLTVPAVSTVIDRRGFSYAAPSMWNEIPVEILLKSILRHIILPLPSLSATTSSSTYRLPSPQIQPYRGWLWKYCIVLHAAGWSRRWHPPRGRRSLVYPP